MMYCKCDLCGKEEPAFSNGREWFKPNRWFERQVPAAGSTPTHMVQYCSTDCLEKGESERIKEYNQSIT